MPRFAYLLLGSALVLPGCGKHETTADKAAATSNALAIAAQPSAGKVGAETANKVEHEPPPVTLSEAIESQSDEANPQLRAKADAARRIVPANSVEATVGQP